MKYRTLGLAFIALILLAPLGPLANRPMSTWIDESHQPFFPVKIAEKVSAYQRFSIFWWNFLVFEPDASGNTPTAAEVSSFCKKLAKENSNLVKSVPCAMSLSSLRPLLEDWSTDLVLRRDSPSTEEAGRRMAATLSKASLPLEREMLELLRNDPFGTSSEFEKLVKDKVKSDFKFENGLFRDEKTGRLIAPIQMSFSPTLTSKTRELNAWIVKQSPIAPRLIGAHHSTLENESTVRDDIQRVSLWGSVLMAVALGVLLFRGHWRLLVFFPPLLLSTGSAIAWTIVVFGSIHGLALAFGPGVIGLSMDYAVHAAFSPSEKNKTWLANFLGVLTTLAVIGAGMLSSLPVLRQLMFFSGAGLLIGFFVFYAFQDFFPGLFVEKVFFHKVQAQRPVALATILLAAASIVALMTLKPAFRMSDLNFETAETAKLQKWIFVDGGMRTPYLQVSNGPTSPLEKANEDRRWADSNGFAVESLARFLPPIAEQQTHLKSWRSTWCHPAGRKSGLNYDLFFQPFFAKLPCDQSGHAIRDLEPSNPVPTYLEDLRAVEKSSVQWVSLWFPNSDTQIHQLKEKFPDISSIGEMVAEFPKILLYEISWMAPITFLISLLLLTAYYRNGFLVFCSILPFFSGFGTYVVASWFIDLKVSFITLIGFIMVFGFSLDYGIFSTDAEESHSKRDTHDSRSEARSALTLTSLLTVAGVAPLMLAQHPAMKHLGEALVYGSIGTYLGAIWGIPYVFKLFRSRNELPKRT